MGKNKQEMNEAKASQVVDSQGGIDTPKEMSPPSPGSLESKGRWQVVGGKGRWHRWLADILQLESVCLIGKRKCWLECVLWHILPILASHLQAGAVFHTHIPPGVWGCGRPPPGAKADRISICAHTKKIRKLNLHTTQNILPSCVFIRL